jgi:hypothetical protein
MGMGIEGNCERSCRKQPDRFAEQCAIRKYESNAIKYVMTDISSHIGVSTHSSKINNEMWGSRGRYTIHFCRTNNRGVGIGEDKVFCVCVDLLTGGESLCHDGVSTHRPVLSPHL